MAMVLSSQSRLLVGLCFCLLVLAGVLAVGSLSGWFRPLGQDLIPARLRQMSKKSAAIGIDLGTTNCCVAYLYPNNQVDIIENELGFRTTPSYIAFTDEGEIIGQYAKEKAFRNAENVVYGSKRLIGRKCDDKYLQRNLKTHTFKVITDDCDDTESTPSIQISLNGKTTSYKPHEISAKLLKHMKNIAEARLEKYVKDAVITVPAHFNYHQRTATKLAGELAGLNVLRIINEPTAAALAYVHKNQISNCENLLIFDLGGGTLDVSLVSVKEKTITVRATSGNTHLGGCDFDNNVTDFIMEKVKLQFNKKIKNVVKVMRLIAAQSEKLKINLSLETVQVFYLPFFLDGEDLEITISRQEFENVNMHLFEKCIDSVRDCLTQATVDEEAVEKVLLIGGSSRIPKLQTMLKTFFNSETELISAINTDEAVAYGAAVQAAETAHEIIDVTPLSLGIEVIEGQFSIIIPRNSQLPITKFACFNTTDSTQSAADCEIFEGERSLTKYNTMIGKCLISFPPKPMGYSIELQMHINANGILEVEGKTEDGIYTKLELEYQKHSVYEVNDVVQDAFENRINDDRKLKVLELWKKLHFYCEKIKAVCSYKSEHINSKDKDTLTTHSQQASDWLNANKVIDGSQEEEDAILHRSNEIEDVCEPVLKKYGYLVKNMDVIKFYEFITH